MFKKRFQTLVGLVLAMTLTLGLAGCGGKSDSDAAAGMAAANQKAAAVTLTVLAGSELKDIEPLLPQITQATGVTLQMRYVGTLEGVEHLANGEAADIAWFASNRYAMLVPEAKSRVLASERTMLTPVVLGLKTSKARELGWINNPDVTWKDIAAAAQNNRFTFGMTSPASSNTGFSGLLGLAAALSGKGDALEQQDVESGVIQNRLAAFFKAQRLTSGSSGWLAEAYLNNQTQVDGIINYASTLLSLNQNKTLREPLVLIYPKDGIVTADYPIMLVNAARRDAYDRLVAYLRGVPFQEAMARATQRRPVNPDAQSTVPGPPGAIAELVFPAKREVVDAILLAFDNQVRLPPDSTFVLDVSGSMQGERLAQLKTAMLGLSGADQSISGRFAHFRERERINIMPFSSRVWDLAAFNMVSDSVANTATLRQISDYIQNRLSARGDTAIYSATQKAYLSALARRRAEPNRFYSVVLLTDGENNEGLDQEDFVRWYKSLPAQDQGIRVFPVVFGEADPQALNQLATLTGGRAFDGRTSDLRQIFKEIRGYQ